MRVRPPAWGPLARLWLRLGAGLGVVAFALGIRRRVALENLARAFPGAPDLARLARAAYAQLGRSLAELWLVRRLPDVALEKLVHLQGWDAFAAAYAQGHGAVVALGHFGNWELLGRAASRRGVAITAITRALRGGFNRRLLAARSEGGLRELPEKNSTRAALEVLRRGETLAVVVDQNMRPKRGVFVDFFGAPACTTPAAAVFALRAGAPLFAVFPVRQPDGTHVVEIEGPFSTKLAGHAAVLDLTQQLTAAVERAVRAHPAHWFWVHRRWKTRPAPPGEAR